MVVIICLVTNIATGSSEIKYLVYRNTGILGVILKQFFFYMALYEYL